MRVIIFLFIIFWALYSCSDPINSKKENELLGSWTETFEYNSMDGIFIGDSLYAMPRIKTSFLNIQEDRFILKILPAEYRLAIDADTLVYRLRFDTLITGNYQIKDSVISFHPLEDEMSQEFNFKLENDSLALNSKVITGNPQDPVVVRLHSFLWGNSYFKNKGKFTRN
jgi:hypothetical protein